MTDATTTISVRGEARHVVPPDLVVISVVVNVRDPDRQDALDRAGRAQAAVVGALRELGGVVLAVSSVDAPLTWATRSFAAHRDEEWDEHKARRHVGWRVHVPVAVTLRDLTKLDAVGSAVSTVPDVDVSHAQWQVDARNPAWPVVRAAAITDAFAKARDYAAALRGEVTALVHVADEGLLGGPDRRSYGVLQRASAVAGEVGEGPALDPAPQEIDAVIEARFEARVDPF
jgi:uncharacterized protein YggE